MHRQKNTDEQQISFQDDCFIREEMIQNKIHKDFYCGLDQRFIVDVESEKRIDVFYQKHNYVL